MELIDEDSMPQLVDFCLRVCNLGLCSRLSSSKSIMCSSILRLERLLRAMEVYVPR